MEKINQESPNLETETLESTSEQQLKHGYVFVW